MTFARLAVLGLAALMLASCTREMPPTDKDLIERFEAKRATFEALRKRLCDLKYDQTITRDWAQPQMAAKDEKDFRALLDEVGARSVRYVRGCQLWIEMWSSGPGRDTARKKYRYGPPMYRIIEIKKPEPGEPPEKDTNEYLDKRVSIASYEKNIEGDWWVELDHWQ
ncbi:MAG: hypothetical protein ISS15_15770 [Alphaproteobacteria bacterium]|nr:hypothetical protein [Alphaproteobacteria bacterium]MBL6938058.1 hypothetical protein [Alphaproteobacteria bacterium]MBL7099117.1 hypothetical protein [Alphaproteobacteria bacterium]